MPRFIITPSAGSPKHESFVKKLIQEFTAASANLQPLIIEEQVPSTKSRHLRVIWDRWRAEVFHCSHCANGPLAQCEQ